MTYSDVHVVIEERPSFGNDSTGAQDVVKFYSSWERFNTKKSFSWCDIYDLRTVSGERYILEESNVALQAPNRRSKRAAQKENEKSRAKGRKEFTELVRVRTLLLGQRRFR